MRINELHIDGFGVYHDYSIQTDTPLTVFYGPNEAGKSTLLALIRTVLYGFPNRAKQWYPPQSGGEHGGRLVIANDAGDMFTVERHQGPHEGPLRVWSADKELHNGSQIVSQLCGRQPRGVFENLLSFNLGELPTVGSKKKQTGPDITSQFYTAAIGANKLHEAALMLKKRQEEIFTTHRAHKKRLKKQLIRLDDLDAELRNVKGQSADYADMTRRIDELTTALDSLDKQITTRTLNRDTVAQCVKSWPLWCDLVELESKLPTEMPDDAFPDDPITRLNALEVSLEEHQHTAATLNATIAKTETQATCVVPYDTLITAKAQCEALIKGETSEQGSRKDLPKRETVVNAEKEKVTQLLQILGPEWTKEQVDSLDISLTQMAHIDEWKTNFGTGREKLQTVETVSDTLEARYRDQELNVTKLNNDIDPNMGDDLDTTETLIQDALELHTAYTDANKALVQALQSPSTNHRSSSQRRPTGRFELAIGALSLSAIALAVWLDLRWLGLLGIGGLGYAALTWWRREKPQGAGTSDHTAEKAEVTRAHHAYKKAVGQLGFSDPDSVEVSHLTKKKEHLSAEISNRKALASARSLLQTLENQKATQRQLKETHERLLDEKETEWRAWLKSGGFPDTLRPEAVELFVAKVRLTQEALRKLKYEENRVYGIKQDIQEYRQQVKDLAEQHDIPLDNSIKDATIWTEEIKTLLEQATDKQAHRKNAQDTLPDLKVQYQTATAALKRDSDKKDELLADAKAKNVEEFRRKANDWLQTQQTISQREETRGQFRAMWMNMHTDDELAEMFQDRTERDLNDKLNCLNASLDGLKTSRDDNIMERAELETKRKSMDGDDQASIARAEREVQRTQANELTEEWSTLMVAQLLLEEAHLKYKKERQPEVILSASEWFKKMTDGRYTRIVPSADNTGAFSVEDRQRRTKTPSQLSRGTQDQLYLALRFGLIQSLGNPGERLPIIVDEALVNCDPKRAKVAARAFVDLAATNQVLVMTCHPWVRDLFVEVSQDVQVVELAP
jgi:uncharacterized protein YhaN